MFYSGCGTWKVYNRFSRIAGVQHFDYRERLKNSASLQRGRKRYIQLHVENILQGCVSNDLRTSFVARPRTGVTTIVPLYKVEALYYYREYTTTPLQLWDNSSELPRSTYQQDCSVPVLQVKADVFVVADPRSASSELEGIFQNTNSMPDWRIDSTRAEI